MSATILSIIYNYNKEYVGIIFLIGALGSLLLSQKFKYIKLDNENNNIGNSSHLLKISIILYIFLCVLLIYIFSVSLEQYYLPWEFFIVVFLISVIILSQILLINKLSIINEKIILFEILFVNIVVFSSFLFLFPDSYGNDAPYHIEFIKNSLNAGFIVGEGQYVNYPVFHLLFIYIIELGKISSFKEIQFILLIVQIIVPLFVFLLTKKIFNSKTALISTLLISFAPYVSQSKYFYFPGTFSIVLFVLTIFLIFNKEVRSVNRTIILLISLLALIFVHPMTPVILIVALMIILITSKTHFNKEKVTLTSILLLLVVTVSWWMKPSDISANNLFSYSILSIKKAFEISDYTSVSVATISPYINKWSLIFSDLGFILLIMLSIMGSLYILANYAKFKNTKLSYKTNAFYLAVITLIFIPIPYLLAIVYPQSIPSRWFTFIEFFSSILAGFCIYILFKISDNQKLKYVQIIMVSSLILLLISNPVINPNSNLYSTDMAVRSGLITSEIDASNFIYQYSNISDVKGNSKFIVFINREPYSKNYLDPSNPSSYRSGILVVRQYDIEKGFTIIYGPEKLMDLVQPNSDFNEYLSTNTTEFYNNGNLKIYLNK
ncbi:glycosyltransferase family 39 protein [Methanobacterium petrolearium]|uniref:glycosyltransferase family 39 protein n=1 Tax=Methanobacterium petrolearium TaxID=710190 RepID=UPI001AE8B380|nr:glycosyltransferase family 39 protein [Methanobacterium petrolearium]MBP1945469.1 hypothetical protein [Methanobacterium petrolearium]BDZ71675.1 hypothetical protein GCM10025861_21920 [Methanobacterium petrolearium]